MPDGERTARYCDSSVLVKCYVAESGSDAAARAIERHRVVSSVVAPIEIAGALRRYRETAPAPEREAAESQLTRERRDWWLVAVDADLVRRAEMITAIMPVRALDAVHLASALTFNEGTGVAVPFVTADERQRRGAIALGLDVIFVE